MGKVFLDMVMSLDGFIAGPKGEDGGLHAWYFAPAGAAVTILEELQRDIGAMVLGRRTYDIGDAQGGFADSPYRVPHFILTRRPQPGVERGGVPFTFITDGLESALAQAKAAAGDRDVCVAGGADVARQAVNASLLDELQLHLVPMLLGRGIRLFEGVEGPVGLEPTRVLESPGATHLRFRVVR